MGNKTSDSTSVKTRSFYCSALWNQLILKWSDLLTNLDHLIPLNPFLLVYSYLSFNCCLFCLHITFFCLFFSLTISHSLLNLFIAPLLVEHGHTASARYVKNELRRTTQHQLDNNSDGCRLRRDGRAAQAKAELDSRIHKHRGHWTEERDIDTDKCNWIIPLSSVNDCKMWK